MKNRIVYLEQCSSTNEEIKKNSNDSYISGRTIVSKYQSKGKGQNGKKWLCKKGDGLLFSIQYLYKLKSDKQNINFLQNLPFFSLLSGVQIRRNLSEWGKKFGLQDKEFQIKWPNDILYANKKIAGILCESQTNATSTTLQLIIGVGINIQNSPTKKELSKLQANKLEATSIKEETLRIENKKQSNITDKQVQILLENIIASLDKYFLQNDIIANNKQIQNWKKKTIPELNLYSFLKNKEILIDGKTALCKEVEINTASLIIEQRGNRQKLYTANFTLL